MKNILIPYDATEFANFAFDQALDLSLKLQSKLFVVTVIGPGLSTTGMSLSRAQEALSEHMEEAKTFLDKVKSKASKKNVKINVEIINDSSAASGILRFAEENKIDLIIIGSHGRSGLTKALLGSVTSGVIKKADCPIMIVKKPKTKGQKN